MSDKLNAEQQKTKQLIIKIIKLTTQGGEQKKKLLQNHTECLFCLFEN
jgi:hypothetical protein